MKNFLEIGDYTPESSSQDVIRNYLEREGYSLQNSLVKRDMSLETRVSIVIPVYNEIGVVEKILKALNGQLFTNFEVVVVDNGSTDETCMSVRDLAKRVNYSLYVISEPNPGVAHARKRGMDEVLIRLARRGSGFSHAIAVTDADTIPPASWTEKIIEGCQQDKIGGLAGTHEASDEVERKIEEVTGITDYFNILPRLIEFLERSNIGVIKMSGPNSAFTSLAYASGDGIMQEYDLHGKPRLSEVDTLGKRIKKLGYTISPMGCRVVKNRRRELYELVTDDGDSYFPKNYSTKGRFNVIREDEMELLTIACETVSKNDWIRYRYKLIYKILKNFIFLPLISGTVTADDIQPLFSSDEIECFFDGLRVLQPNQVPSSFIEQFLSSHQDKFYECE